MIYWNYTYTYTYRYTWYVARSGWPASRSLHQQRAGQRRRQGARLQACSRTYDE